LGGRELAITDAEAGHQHMTYADYPALRFSVSGV